VKVILETECQHRVQTNKQTSRISAPFGLCATATPTLLDDRDPEGNGDLPLRPILRVSDNRQLDLLERKPEQRLRPEATDTREQEHGKERDPDSRGARDGVGSLPHGICNSDDIFCCRLYLVDGQLGMKLEFSRTGCVNPLHAQGLEN
jgi:hypothetical protein